MPRLNTTTRDNIRRALLEHRFRTAVGERIDANRQLFRDAADAVFQALYPGKQDVLAAVPRGWLYDYSYIYVGTLGGRTYKLAADGEIRIGAEADRYWRIGRAERDRNFASLPHGCYAAKFDADAEIVVAAEAAFKASAELFKTIDAAERKIREALGAYSTTEKLVEAWPEVAPFIPTQAAAAPAVTNLPAVVPSQLNALLNLPAEG